MHGIRYLITIPCNYHIYIYLIHVLIHKISTHGSSNPASPSICHESLQKLYYVLYKKEVSEVNAPMIAAGKPLIKEE